MPLRLITALVAALALLPAAAFAQEPTATPGPPDNASDAVKLIYEDYRRDGKIDVCDHERADLQDAVDTIEPDFDQDYPDFREALEAGITRHDNGRCDATPTPTATATATASPTVTPDDGTLPPPEDDDGTLPPPDDGTTPPPDDGTLPETGDPLPTDPTPAPTTAPPAAQSAPPAATPTPVPTPTTVSTKADRSELLIPGLLVALALIGALALVFFGRRSPAWREATFRTRATWADFTDWLRLGR